MQEIGRRKEEKGIRRGQRWGEKGRKGGGGDWCPKLRVFEGMTQPLIQVFKYLMQEVMGGEEAKQEGLTTELSVKTRIY